MRRFLSVCLLAMLVFGCGGSGKRTAHAPVFPVHGKVTFNGQPVVGATVTFTSEVSNRSAFGKTDDEGIYYLTTFNSNDGAVEGKQSVTVDKFVASVPTAPVAETESLDYVPPGYEKTPPPAPVKAELPAKFAKVETSGLLAVVNAEPDNEINFDLKD